MSEELNKTDNSEENKSEKIIQSDVSKSSVIKSLIWKFLERGGVQGVQFVLQIVLARLLCPEDYGVLAILLAFVALADVFVQTGFNTALIQKKDSDELDFSSVFWLSLFVAAVLYVVLFICSPLIAKFYKMDILKNVLRVLAIRLFFGALNSVQNAMVSKTMKFKRFFFSSMGGVIGSGIVGIVLAYMGFGVWALVAQQLVNAILISIILWFTVKWRPQFKFSFERVKTLFSFGWKLLCSALLNTGYNQLYSLVIGRVYTSADLGEFTRGQQFPQVISTNLDGAIQSVMLPTLAAHADNKNEVKRIMRRSITMSAFVLMPCMFGMAAVAKPMVQVLLTDKWLGCVPFVMLACFSFVLYPIHTANLTAVNAIGRSDVFLKLEIIKKIYGLVILILTIKFGLIPLAIGQVVSGIISTFVNASPNKKLLGYSYFEQLKDLFPYFLSSLCMFAGVYAMNWIPVKPIFLLLLQILAGALIYVAICKIFKIEAFEYMLNIIKNKRKGQ